MANAIRWSTDNRAVYGILPRAAYGIISGRENGTNRSYTHHIYIYRMEKALARGLKLNNDM